MENYTQPTKITENMLRKATETLKRYKSAKSNLTHRVVDDDDFWKQRYWRKNKNRTVDGEETTLEQKAKYTSGWLVNAVLNRHADAVDNYPEPNCLPRAMDDKEEAQKLTKILPVVLQQNDFERTWSDCWWNKLKSGTAIYGVFWNQSKLNGLGDIDIKRCDILNLFWEPGVLDIQDSQNLFSVELVDKNALIESYPQLEGKLKSNTDLVAKYHYDDSVDTSDKAEVIDWYYKRGGKVHYVKYVETTVLYATEEDPNLAERGLYDHGKYPFIFDTLFREEGTPAGYGFIDIGKDAQIQIDLLNEALIENTKFGATPRFFINTSGSVNEAEFADWEKTFIHVDGTLGEDSIQPITVTPLPTNYLSFMEMKINELRETSGNTESYSGTTSSSVTAASAIAALQEASGKLSRDMINGAYRAYKEICIMVIDLIRQFYDLPREFRITGEYGKEEFISYDNEGLQPVNLGYDISGEDIGYRTPIIDIDVQPENESKYTKAEYNQLALNLYQAGIFNPQNADQALVMLGMMDFKGKDELQQKINMNKTLSDMLQESLNRSMVFAQIVDQYQGTNYAQQEAQLQATMGMATPMAQIVAVEDANPNAEASVTKNAREQSRSTTDPVNH